MTKIPLSQQAVACDTMSRVLSGGLKPSKKEREFLAERMTAATESLRFIELHEDEFRDFIRNKREGVKS